MVTFKYLFVLPLSVLSSPSSSLITHPVKVSATFGAVLVTVILPDPVTGDPDTLIPVPAVIPTEVTVPCGKVDNAVKLPSPFTY